MSSSFQSAEVAEFSPVPKQQVQENVKEEQKDPLDQEIGQILQSMSTWEQNEQNIEKIWTFLGIYVSFLENKQEMIYFLHKIYGKEIGTNLIVALKKIKGREFQNLEEFIQLIHELPDSKLSPEEKIILNKLKLQTEQGHVLGLVAGIIRNLPTESHKKLNDIFHAEMSKDKYSLRSKQKGKSVSFLDQKMTIPGTSTKIDCKAIIGIVIAILVILIGIVYFMYVRKGVETSTKKTKTKSSYLSDGESSVMSAFSN